MNRPGPEAGRRSGHVVVDIGKSGTRIRRQALGDTLTGPGAPPERAGSPDAAALLFELVRGPWAAAPSAGTVSAVTIGTTFLPSRPAIAEAVRRLGGLFPGAGITVLTDGVLNHAAALGGPGTVAAVGTGTAIVGCDANGRLHRFDAWGPDLGDRGSAGDLGRAGLRLACSAIDGVASAPGLVAAATDWLGRRPDIPAAIELLATPNRVERLATFALVVCDLAAAGDREAAELVARSARDVVATCAAAARLIDDTTLVLVGRLVEVAGFRNALDLALAGSGLRERPPAAQVLDVAVEVVAQPLYQRWAGRSLEG